LRSYAGRAVAALFAVGVAAAALAPACGTSETGNSGGATGSGGGGGTVTTTTTTQMPPKGSCGQPGDKGNNHGVGAYCTPGGKQCENYPLAALCLADVGQDQWFCSRIGCQKDSDCGNDATCVMQQGSSGCVPNRCLDGTTTGSGGASGTGGTSGTSGSGGSNGAGGSGGSPPPP
jgi:hypothetical protein